MVMADRQKFGEYLRELRLQQGMTQAELGAKAGGVRRQAVCNWERAHEPPPLHRLRKIAAALNVHEDDLVRRYDEEYDPDHARLVPDEPASPMDPDLQEQYTKIGTLLSKFQDKKSRAHRMKEIIRYLEDQLRSRDKKVGE